MLEALVITVITNDRPGIVEKLAETIRSHEGNWLEGNMSQLAGKFAGILRINVLPEKRSQLEEALQALSAQGISVRAEIDRSSTNSTAEKQQRLTFSLVGSDRPGIVHETSRALASTGVNVVELQTRCTSMPWSGEPMFEASGILSVPEEESLAKIEASLQPIANELGLDVSVEPDTGN